MPPKTKGAGSALRAKILAVHDIKSEIVVIRDWDNIELKLVGLTGAERLKVIEKATVTETAEDDAGKPVKTTRQDNALLYPLLVIAAAHDPETDELVFNDGDLEVINGKNAGVIEDVALRVCALSGMTVDASRVMAKNSATTRSDDSASA